MCPPLLPLRPHWDFGRPGSHHTRKTSGATGLRLRFSLIVMTSRSQNPAPSLPACSWTVAWPVGPGICVSPACIPDGGKEIAGVDQLPNEPEGGWEPMNGELIPDLFCFRLEEKRRAGGPFDDPLGHAAEENFFKSFGAVGADNNQINFLFADRVNDGINDIAPLNLP